MAVLFDTLKLAERLEAAGMPPRQARDMASALAETITGDLVTREYLDLRLGEMETRLRGEIHDGDARLRTEIEKVRADVRDWLISQAFAIVGAVAALVGLAAALTHLFH